MAYVAQYLNGDERMFSCLESSVNGVPQQIIRVFNFKKEMETHCRSDVDIETRVQRIQ
jgi:hypothetical protein